MNVGTGLYVLDIVNCIFYVTYQRHSLSFDACIYTVPECDLIYCFCESLFLTMCSLEHFCLGSGFWLKKCPQIFKTRNLEGPEGLGLPWTRIKLLEGSESKVWAGPVRPWLGLPWARIKTLSSRTAKGLRPKTARNDALLNAGSGTL